MDRPPPRLVLLSGFAAPPLMMQRQSDAFPDLVVPPWIVPERRESLRHYAFRFAEQLRPLLPDDRPLVLGGLSFGGVVALEMAAVLRPARLVLIASCREPRGVPWRLSLLRPLAEWTPRWAVRTLAPPLSRVYAWVEGMTPAEAAIFRGVAERADLPILRWGLWALQQWRAGAAPPRVGAPVAVIHGDRDLLLPIRLAEPDEIARGGHHLINLTHAAQVNAFLRHQVALAAGSALGETASGAST